MPPTFIVRYNNVRSDKASDVQALIVADSPSVLNCSYIVCEDNPCFKALRMVKCHAKKSECAVMKVVMLRNQSRRRER